ncbi:Homeobox-leucine zipper protein HOX29 [Capsicum baccatum]|uniref:Homeobox-leucine zipper protein HOX29 n=1 Tax=Capsicum baccatum TaxID=33114 RepID=A0A2G2VCG2_CAPBA|nr:Homeobox-leucine zipper protein HOX29 [Capsicum baccatum]
MMVCQFNVEAAWAVKTFMHSQNHAWQGPLVCMDALNWCVYRPCLFPKPGPDSIGIIAISYGCTGMAARACGVVGLDPTRVTAEILKDRLSWYRDCRAVEVPNMLPTANGGTIELLYMQLYAPTTLAPPHDFWLLRYTTVTDDGSFVVCERSLGNTQNGLSMPPVQNFVRAEMLPSGYLIWPCEGSGSIVHIVDHMNLEVKVVPEVLRPLYESSSVLAQKITMAALRQLRQLTLEVSQPNVTNWGRRPAALRALSKRLSRGFNEALNGFSSEDWSMQDNDGIIDDVTILVNSSPDKRMGLNLSFSDGFTSISNAVLCAKASMLLQKMSFTVVEAYFRPTVDEALCGKGPQEVRFFHSVWTTFYASLLFRCQIMALI